MSPIDVVADIGIAPDIVADCYALFLENPYAHGGSPGEDGPIIAAVKFRDGIPEWKRVHGIAGNVVTWFRAAMDLVTCDPRLLQRSFERAQAIKRGPTPMADQYGLSGDAWLLAAFEMVFTDDALRACCHERARDLTRFAMQDNPGLV